MMTPKGGVYACNKCGVAVDKSKSSSQVLVTDSKNRETTVITEDIATLPKTDVTCPQCEHPEAYFVIRQTRAADEPETRIYRCCKCGHSWREY